MGNFGSDFASVKVQKLHSGGRSSIVTKLSMIRNTWSRRWSTNGQAPPTAFLFLEIWRALRNLNPSKLPAEVDTGGLGWLFENHWFSSFPSVSVHSCCSTSLSAFVVICILDFGHSHRKLSNCIGDPGLPRGFHKVNLSECPSVWRNFSSLT